LLVEHEMLRAIRQVTRFTTWLEDWHAERFGGLPVDECGEGPLGHHSTEGGC
jgi:hypothetical protein